MGPGTGFGRSRPNRSGPSAKGFKFERPRVLLLNFRNSRVPMSRPPRAVAAQEPVPDSELRQVSGWVGGGSSSKTSMSSVLYVTT